MFTKMKVENINNGTARVTKEEYSFNFIFKWVGGVYEFDEIDFPMGRNDSYHMNRKDIHLYLKDIHMAARKLEEETNNNVQVRLPNPLNGENPY